MKKDAVVRGILAAAFLVTIAVGLMTTLAPATAAQNKCEQACHREYRRCVPFCSKNPCFVACETVLEICLSNCGS